MSDTAPHKFLSFTLDGEFFAFAIVTVREILDFCDITRIPQTPSFIRGVVNLRGNAVSVVDLKEKFGLGRTQRTINTRIIILELPHGNQTQLMGALADSVKEVLELEPTQIDPPPHMGARVRMDFITGVARHKVGFLLLLDASRIFAAEELGDFPRSASEPAAS